MDRHRQRHPADWPDPGGTSGRRMFRDWLDALIKIEAREAELEGASVRLKERTGPDHAQEHLPALLSLILSARESQVAPTPAERDEAWRKSAGCPYCDARDESGPNPATPAPSGLLTLFHPLYAGSPIVVESSGRRVAGRVATFCACPLGRWM